MNSDNICFGTRLVTTIKLGFLIHNLARFSRKGKKHNLKVYAHILAQ